MIFTVVDRKTAGIKRKRSKIFLTHILNNDKLYPITLIETCRNLEE